MPTRNYHSLTFVLPKRDLAMLNELARLCGHIERLGIIDITVLSFGKTLDLHIFAANTGLKRQIDNALKRSGIPADYCIQSANNRRKKLLICDMDSTLIGQECIDELADFAGVKELVSEITERAMQGEIDFEAALLERVSLLKDLPLSALNDCFQQRIRLNNGAKTLCKTMKAAGAKTVIVSGGFTFFTDRIARLAGFDTHQANTLIDDGKVLTGKVGAPILGREAKKIALIKYSAEFGGAKHAISIGDGANDLSMIQASGLGIAYYAKPIVASAAHCAINHTDLATALYFQGYHEKEFYRD